MHGRNTPYSPTLEHIKGGYLASLYSSRPTVFRASAVLLNPGRHIQGELCWVRARRWQVCVGCGLDLIVCRLGSDCRRVLCVVGSLTAPKKGATRAPYQFRLSCRCPEAARAIPSAIRVKSRTGYGVLMVMCVDSVALDTDGLSPSTSRIRHSSWWADAGSYL